ncbi:cell wall-active antibiotics response protein LiaF [Paenibacillus sp. IHBB 10380]|uniref:cell wall-active antibiotics response protein LiaF n=1 Tax=Paenibacillus sp. IHBB 10380 TaxID=1566358 RepID=UPI0005CFA9D9|nr:cell wall-active antibiotics response protein LiaF [Paenibacillus sp. IHBB 10380]AJS60098.1 membrane protein [Paenibacillus sp. IHBB 10380]
MEKRNRIIAMCLISVGFLMLFGKLMDFFTIVALLFIVLGIYKIRGGNFQKGYLFMGIGAALILLDHFFLVIAICLISLGLFYAKAKREQPKEGFIQKLSFMSHFDWDQAPWVMRNTSVWHVLGEADLDLSLGMPEDKQTVMMFQGIMGDMDMTIPEYYGVEIEAFVLFGSIDFDGNKDSGMMNRISWKSPNYSSSEYKIKFIVSYLVGDMDIRLS